MQEAAPDVSILSSSDLDVEGVAQQYAILSGVGIVMLPGRARDHARPARRVQGRRMATLLVLSLEKLSAMAEAMQGALLLRPHTLKSIYTGG